jgi:hypothetical protein
MRPDPTPAPDPQEPNPIPPRPDQPDQPGQPEIPQIEPGPEVIPPSIPEKPDIPPSPHGGKYADGGGEPRELVIEHPDKHHTDAQPQ